VFDYETMCCDVAANLWALYYERPNAPCLILPSKRDGILRVSEQESRILITQWLQSHGIHYSIETPTTRCYQQSGQALLSARIDVTVYALRDAASRSMNLELKAGTSTLEAFRKDFEKLLCEGLPGLWFHTLESASEDAWRTISTHMEEAFRRVAPHADAARHTIWFAFCVLEAPELVQFEIDFSAEWRGQISRSLAQARGEAVGPPYRANRPGRRIAATDTGSSGPSSYGRQQKLLIYAPSINPASFLHLSVKGESYALREFPPSGPTRRWVLDDARTTSQLKAKHRFVQAIDVAHERENLDGEREYWRQRIAALNLRFGLA
jgi:hypothetical protein